MTPLDDWTSRVCAALDIEPTLLDRDVVLDLTKDVAHGVARPAAPLTAYLLGIAVGRSTAGGQDIRRIVATVRDLLPAEGADGG